MNKKGCRATGSNATDEEKKWSMCDGGCDLRFGSVECKTFRATRKAITETRVV